MQDNIQPQRLISLDFYRGFIMVLLALESAGLFEHLYEGSEDSFLGSVLIQFYHHPWNGLRFWDLIQPGFMFIAGTAMALSLHKQLQNGVPWKTSFIKVLKRSGWLFFWGVLDYAVRPGGLSFELWDVLTQLSFTTLVAFLIFRFSFAAQLSISLGLLLLTEILYRFTNVSGFDQPFTDQHNFGNFMDLMLMNKINQGGWVAINCIPTAAHTIWGSLAGKLLISDKKELDKIKLLVTSGLIGLLLGYSMDWTVTPIIKRIATSSFVFASGGWCLLGLAFVYWWIDVRDHKRYLSFFTIVGMNSLFIYLFFEIIGSRWFNEYIGAISNGMMKPLNLPDLVMGIISSLCIFGLEWGMCYWLYKRNVFFRI